LLLQTYRRLSAPDNLLFPDFMMSKGILVRYNPCQIRVYA
jgi:hypothetical protein